MTVFLKRFKLNFWHAFRLNKSKCTVRCEKSSPTSSWTGLYALLHSWRRKSNGQSCKRNSISAPSKKFQKLFSAGPSVKTPSYCTDIAGLARAMDIEYKAKDWRLFIDGSSYSLKAVLLHKTNKKPSLPLFLSTDSEEDYNSLNRLTELLCAAIWNLHGCYFSGRCKRESSVSFS